MLKNNHFCPVNKKYEEATSEEIAPNELILYR